MAYLSAHLDAVRDEMFTHLRLCVLTHGGWMFVVTFSDKC